MSAPLSAQTIALVKATVPALEAHGLDITRRMYQRMFANEAIRDLFNQSHHGDTGSQPKALASAVLAYAQNIDRLDVLGAAVERIAQKHVGLQILPEHYPAVAESLLGAIKDILGDAATDEILAAWGEAYWFLADILIGREKQIYDDTAASPGGWSGWRNFVVERKERESDIITSFILRPQDGGPVVRHRPGQYLTFWLEIPGHASAEAELQHFQRTRRPHLPDLGQAGAGRPRLQLAARHGGARHRPQGGPSGGRVLPAGKPRTPDRPYQRRRRPDPAGQHARNSRPNQPGLPDPPYPRHAERRHPRPRPDGVHTQHHHLLRGTAPRRSDRPRP